MIFVPVNLMDMSHDRKWWTFNCSGLNNHIDLFLNYSFIDVNFRAIKHGENAYNEIISETDTIHGSGFYAIIPVIKRVFFSLHAIALSQVLLYLLLNWTPSTKCRKAKSNSNLQVKKLIIFQWKNQMNVIYWICQTVANQDLNIFPR